jgi:hypothetical protein
MLSFTVQFTCVLNSCTNQNQQSQTVDSTTLEKIKFNVDELNENELCGPPDGLRSLDCKFCIPFDEKYINEISSIDSSIKFHKGTCNSYDCEKGEYLCIGNTHQKDFKIVLIKLASLDFVTKIEQMFWEE